MDAIADIRQFNRYYTRVVGLLDEHLARTAFTLPEARVLYELAHAEQTAAEVARRLDMDKAHLSRIVARLRARGLLAGRTSPLHGKQILLTPTAAGRKAFEWLEAGTRDRIGALLAPLGPALRQRLLAAMRDIQCVLSAAPTPADEVVLRPLKPGDAGWVVHRQAALYHLEYGWDWTYEALIARILGDFIEAYDPAREDAWVAELDGTVVGSVFLVRSDDPAVAKLRLLYVDPSARGRGIGARLVRTCIARARELGYRQLTLWTNDILVAARHIYEAEGFRLVAQAPHRSFGHDLVGQTWTLDLVPDTLPK